MKPLGGCRTGAIAYRPGDLYAKRPGQLLCGLFPRGGGEVARHAIGLDFNASRDFARVIERSRVDKRQWAAVVFRFILPRQLLAIEAAGDRQVFVFLVFAGARELVFGLY